MARSINYVFDVDGTLTPSRLVIDSEFEEFFINWIKDKNVYLLTGSDHENTIEQLDEFALLDKIKKGVGSVIKKVRDKFSQMWNWIKEKVSNTCFDLNPNFWMNIFSMF